MNYYYAEDEDSSTTLRKPPDSKQSTHTENLAVSFALRAGTTSTQSNLTQI